MFLKKMMTWTIDQQTHPDLCLFKYFLVSQMQRRRTQSPFGTKGNARWSGGVASFRPLCSSAGLSAEARRQ